MSKPDYVTHVFGPVAYQHVNNGGFVFQTIRTDTRAADGRSSRVLELEIRHTSMGVGTAVRIPCFQTTADILSDIAERIRNSGTQIDPLYLQPINAVLEYDDGTLVKEWKAVARGSNVDSDVEGDVTQDEAREDGTNVVVPNLAELMQKHRIAVSPEFESTLWYAEVYDNESPTPTRCAIGNTPLEAVQLALQKPVPEYGDSLDKINQHQHIADQSNGPTGAPE